MKSAGAGRVVFSSRHIKGYPNAMPLLPTIQEEDNLSWFRLMRRYRKQFHAMAAAAAIYVAGGMKMAWSVFESPTGLTFTNANTHQLTITWPLGVILGAAIAAMLQPRLSKNITYCSSGGLLLTGGILFIVLPTSFAALTISCLCEGCAFGIVQVDSINLGGVIAHKDIRGLIMSSERVLLWFGICLQLLCTRIWYAVEPASGYWLHVHQLHGILVVTLALISVILALLHRIESPVILHMQHRDLAAMNVLKRLQGTHYPSAEVMRLRDDCKQLLTFDAERSFWLVFRQQNLMTLLKIVLVRCYVMLSLSLPYNRAFLTVSWNGFGCDMNCIYVLALCGFMGSIAGGLLVDGHGRRRLSVVTLLLAGIFMFIVGGIFKHLQAALRIFSILDLEVTAFLMLLYQLITCCGIAIASVAYMSEAFTVRLKPLCIAVVIVCEQLLQVLLSEIVFHLSFSNAAFFFSIGTLSLLLGLLVFFVMPETRSLTLIECLEKFKATPR